MHHKQNRNGPIPLWLHLNGGAAMMAAASEDVNMFAASQTILTEALDGVKAYHESNVQPYHREMTEVLSHNGSRILSAKEWQANKYVLLIPSLINEWRIFDIEEDYSFAAFLASEGYCPLILEWATPDKNISLNEYIEYHCMPLIRQLIDADKSIEAVIGYCMGGTIIPALYSGFSDSMQAIDKVVMVASPWDFSYQSIEQKTRLQTLAMQSYALGDIAPNDYVQSLFWAIDPLQVIKKFRQFPDVHNPDRFVRVEDWLNAGRLVSTSVIQTCLFDWYRDNKIVQGEWQINEQTVTSKSLPKRSLIVAGQSDNLVPLASVTPLKKAGKYLEVDTGHIGLMASDKSLEKCWKPIAQFLKADSMSS